MLLKFWSDPLLTVFISVAKRPYEAYSRGPGKIAFQNSLVHL